MKIPLESIGNGKYIENKVILLILITGLPTMTALTIIIGFIVLCGVLNLVEKGSID